MAETTLRCANCAASQPGRFCARCGEKRIDAADHTLRRFGEHLFEAFTHVDGKIFLTVRSLLFRPGRLTADYLHGKRKPLFTLSLQAYRGALFFITFWST